MASMLHETPSFHFLFGFILGAPQVRAILPVLIGPANGPEEISGFAPFPFHKLSRLSNAPSAKTNQAAAAILRVLGISETKITEFKDRSVRQLIFDVLQHQVHQCANGHSKTWI